MRKFYYLLFLQFCFYSSIYAQEQFGSISGIVTSAETGEVLPFVNVSVNLSGNLVGTTTDFDGKYQLDSIPVGVHSLICSYVGTSEKIIEGIKIVPNKEIKYNIQLPMIPRYLDCLKIIEIYKWNPPLFSDDTHSGIIVKRSRSGLFYPSNIR